MRFKTRSGATYEVNRELKQIRKLDGATKTRRLSPLGQWKDYVDITDVVVGKYLFITWEPQTGPDRMKDFSITTPIVEIEPDDRPPPEQVFGHFDLATGGATVAALHVGEGEYRAGVSFCSPRDQYDRKRGRAIALGRAAAGAALSFEFERAAGEAVPETMRRAFVAFVEGAGEDLPLWLRRRDVVYVTSRRYHMVGKAVMATLAR